MKRWQIWFLGGCIAAGLVYILIPWGQIYNPVLYLRGRLSAILFWGGLGLLLLFAGHAVFITRRNRRTAQEFQRFEEKQQINRRRFLQRLDHELKNPLTAIRAGMTNICSEPLNDYVAREVAAVQSQALRISRLVADLRKIASLEEKPLDLVRINLAHLLEEIVEIIKDRNDLDGRDLTLLTPTAPWPLPEVEGDPDLLLLAVHNLIENALKYTQPGDTVEVRAHEEGRFVVVEVADTGRGIPVIEQPRVWEELYRGSQSHGVPGSGLGLSLVKSIVEMHGGKVALRSKPAQGSVFSIYIPIA